MVEDQLTHWIPMPRKIVAGLAQAIVMIVVVPCLGSFGFAQSPPAGFVAPPRTIADITAILDQEKPDPTVVARLRAEAEAKAPANAGRLELAKVFYKRCVARSDMGQFRSAIEDCAKAVEVGTGIMPARDLTRLRHGLALEYMDSGDYKKALGVLLEAARVATAEGIKGWLFGAHRYIALCHIRLGNFSQAEAYLRKDEALLREARGWPQYRAHLKASWNFETEATRAHLHEARGQYREAEAAYNRAESWQHEFLRQVHNYEGLPPQPDRVERSIDMTIAAQGRMKARQGRVAEGEVDVRRALLSRLKARGKYNLTTAQHIGGFAQLLIQQGRFAEAEQLTRTQLDIQRTLGMPADAQPRASVLNRLATLANLQERWDEAMQLYAELEDATKGWETARREGLQLSAAQIVSLYNANNLAAGLAAAERLLGRQKALLGENHVGTAGTRGLMAIGLTRSGRDAEALREFKAALPILMARSRETDDEQTFAPGREQRIQLIIEGYIALLARTAHATGVDAAAESFRLADSLRGQSVQRALAASSARAVASNPALADLVRREQDLAKQVGAQLGRLNNVLALAPHERDEKAVKALESDIAKMRTARDAAKKQLASSFRNYASLVEPTPPTVDEIRAVMRADEAFLSFYFGRETSFVWAVPKSGPVAFAAISASAGDIDEKVRALREALEPNAAMVSDIPPFDLALAHELYKLLLEPVEAGWKGAKSLIVSTNGALGLLPLGVLPTAPSKINLDAEPPFAGYRAVPWLARSHAVTLVPSAAALRTLRQLPPVAGNREQMIGFGDPLFSKRQAEVMEAERSFQVASATSRGLRLNRRATPQTRIFDSAQLSLLPRLPDTADELKSIALTLQADPSKVLYLGKAANEDAVKKADLSRIRVIAFATHGLVPGELDGLHQRALALSAPDVAGVPGDGLLTMEEILALKLNADWVVLSACNTGAGAGAGAEAASGLGRAFFYAGTRAILVTNWSVDSQSARDLVTDLFRRQAADAQLSRGEALRQAMMALMDGKGFTDERGEVLFTYAHPLFWAPYTIIGDGG